MAPMQFGFALQGRGPLSKPEILFKLAQKGDALRYDSVFVTDHVVIPVEIESAYPYSANGRVASDWKEGYLEPLPLMAHLAALTKRIRIGTSVLIIPYRNPVVTAKMLATMDVLSGGRIILGAGVGWMEEEFQALNAPAYKERGRVTDEFIRLMREMWTREPVDFKGQYYTLGKVSALPKPVQSPHPPLVLGGSGKQRSATLAARFADEYNVAFKRNEVGAIFGRVREAAAETGRELVYSVAETVCVGRDDAEVKRRAKAIGRDLDELRQSSIAGSPGEAVERIGEAASHGATRVYLQVLDLADLDHLELIASEVMPQL